MKIVKLEAENIKRLRAVEITPDGNTVVISGRNGQGKTSVLDSIWFALGGGPASRGTSKPIRDGQDGAHVTLDLGELQVTRAWKGDKTTLKVSSADGAVYKSPQSMLDNLVGRLSFDPLAFAQQDERTQMTSLLELVELPFDPDELARQRAGVFERRTEAGRVRTALEGQLAGIPANTEELPQDELALGDLLAEHRDALRQISDHDDAEREVGGTARNVERYTERVTELENQLADARQTLTEHQADHAAAVKRADSMTASLPDVAAIEKRLGDVERINTAVRLEKQRTQVTHELVVARAAWDKLAEQIAALDARKATAIAEAKMPIDGLAFDEAGVTYRGVPFKQCSAAEQLRVSLAMAMTMNPQIRVIRITDGSLLDSENMRLIAEMADEHDYQVWIERVDESGAVGVVIEDGLVAS